MIGATHGKHGIFEFFLHDTYVGHSLEMLGEYSEAELGLLKQLCGPGDVVVEVGANIGALSVPLARHICQGGAGELICFEPQRAARNLLKANLRRNAGLDGWCVHEEALGSAQGMTKITEPRYTAPGNFGAVEVGIGPGLAKVTTLDSYNLPRLRLLKVDVEGCEADVLRGARETIARCVPVIYVENDRAEKSAEMIGLLFELGYRCFWHLPPLYQPMNAKACGVNPWPGMVSINMLCVPRSVQVDIPLLEVTGVDADWRSAAAIGSAAEPGQKTVAVVRPGAYGDALWASSILPHLKAQGYHVTVYTELHGAEVLKHDPHIDRLVVHDPKQEHTGAYYAQESEKFDRWINLAHSVEGALLPEPSHNPFHWPAAARRARFNVNYLEHVHQVADVPYEPRMAFYPDADEEAFVDQALRGLREVVVAIAASGSTWPKWWPYLPQLLEQISNEGWSAVVLGDVRAPLPDLPGVFVPGMSWTIRQAMTFMHFAHACIGQETGLMNAVAFTPVPKIVLLSHSSNENLTRDWENCTPMAGAPACYPCHQLHFDRATCTVDAATGAAACQAGISVEAVMAELRTRLALYGIRRQMEAA